MVRRHEITDTAWEQIAPLLPANRGRGGRWADHRTMLNGMLYKLATGCPWRDLPQRYGPWQSVYGRYRRWAADGTFDAIWSHVQTRQDAVGRIHWQVSIDSTAVRAHAHAAGARKKGSAQTKAAQALGRSRGGLTTKIHLAADGRGLPLALLLSPGNVNDCTMAPLLLAAIRVPRSGRGRPRTRPDGLIADKAYSLRALRRLLRRRRIRCTIPERADQKANRAARGGRGGRPPAFDRGLYRQRNVVERCIGRLKHYRAIATRFDKLAAHYRAGIVLVSVMLWLNHDPQNTP
ncbi:IS5 family transposase [Streptomonospora nanhaiensis]